MVLYTCDPSQVAPGKNITPKTLWERERERQREWDDNPLRKKKLQKIHLIKHSYPQQSSQRTFKTQQ
jgi:hypothetical protein